MAAANLINASGAWADVIAGLAGAKPVGLVPKRRTAFTFDAPAGLALERMPMVIDFGETWYIKPEVGQFLGSPADETPSPPTDAQPEEIDIALAVERIQTATTLQIHRIKNKWAGLRSFVAGKNPGVWPFDERPAYKLSTQRKGPRSVRPRHSEYGCSRTMSNPLAVMCRRNSWPR